MLIFSIPSGITEKYDWLYKVELPTPLTIRVPTLVMKPLTLSDLGDDTTKVEPGSLGASKAMHSSRPLLKETKVSCKLMRSHSSSRA